jgi:hypothetical protein
MRGALPCTHMQGACKATRGGAFKGPKEVLPMQGQPRRVGTWVEPMRRGKAVGSGESTGATHPTRSTECHVMGCMSRVVPLNGMSFQSIPPYVACGVRGVGCCHATPSLHIPPYPAASHLLPSTAPTPIPTQAIPGSPTAFHQVGW